MYKIQANLMAISGLDLQTQTLYAELLERVMADTIGPFVSKLETAFVPKTVRGHKYWYLQYRDSEGMRQMYLGRETVELLALIGGLREQAKAVAGSLDKRRKLSAALQSMGFPVWPGPLMQVCERLASHGMFANGAILVGTLAYSLAGGVLGFRLGGSSTMTNDVDLSFGSGVQLALPDTPETDVPGVLDGLKMGFLPVPQLDSNEPFTSFKVRDSDLRVDFLTILRRKAGPVYMPRFKTAALPLPFMDYLIQEPVKAVVPFNTGILVNIPNPAHLAVHKIIVSSERTVREQAKSRKDIDQAGDLFMALLGTRPRDIEEAFHDAWGRGPKWRAALKQGFRQLAIRQAVLFKDMAVSISDIGRMLDTKRTSTANRGRKKA